MLRVVIGLFVLSVMASCSSELRFDETQFDLCTQVCDPSTGECYLVGENCGGSSGGGGGGGGSSGGGGGGGGNFCWESSVLCGPYVCELRSCGGGHYEHTGWEIATCSVWYACSGSPSYSQTEQRVRFVPYFCSHGCGTDL